MQQLPVLIVGAGPTGLTAAMELQRMGRWVHPLLDPSRFTLLVFGDGVDEKLLDLLPACVVAQAVGAAPEDLVGKDVLLALVRPDGYLALAVRAHETPALERWLDRWLSHGPGFPFT